MSTNNAPKPVSKPSPIVELLSGQLVNLHEVDARKVSIDDIVDGLARISRFNGRSSAVARPISVLEHSYAVYLFALAHVIMPEALADILMHDCAEVLIGDVISPVKNMLPALIVLENMWRSDLCHRIGIRTNDENVAYVDRLARHCEYKCVVADEDMYHTNAHSYGFTPDELSTRDGQLMMKCVKEAIHTDVETIKSTV